MREEVDSVVRAGCTCCRKSATERGLGGCSYIEDRSEASASVNISCRCVSGHGASYAGAPLPHLLPAPRVPGPESQTVHVWVDPFTNHKPSGQWRSGEAGLRGKEQDALRDDIAQLPVPNRVSAASWARDKRQCCRSLLELVELRSSPANTVAAGDTYAEQKVHDVLPAVCRARATILNQLAVERGAGAVPCQV